MSDLGLGDLKDVGVLLALGGMALKLWWSDREKRREKTEEKVEKVEENAETRSEQKLDKVIESQARIEGEIRDLRNTSANQAGIVAAVDRRVEGLSGAYGPAIEALKLQMARLEERIGTLSPKRKA